jgi:hypothetical protein
MTWYHPKHYAALRAARKKLQATSAKQQATSNKREAQPEVVLDKKSIDKDPDVGYHGTDDVTAIHGGHSSARSVQPKATSNTGDAPHMGPRNSAAETLHLEQHKYPGDGSSRMVQGYGPSSIFLSESSNKRQATDPEATSYKPQAPSKKVQASSHKLQAPRSLNLETIEND